MRINRLITTKYHTKIKKIKTNSKDIEKGDVFVCTLGNVDKTLYLEEALSKGCSFVICAKDLTIKIPYLRVSDVDKSLKVMLDRYYHYPLSKINLIGVTGTDGKTSITTILKDMTQEACLGTNGFYCNNQHIELKNTTPSLDYIYDIINKAIKFKKKNVFMEVSSEAYLNKRIPNLFFDIGVFTNITKEHLDKHKDFNNYFACKMKLLKNCNVAIINHDSPYFKKIKRVNCNYRTYGFRNSDITILSYRLYLDHTFIHFLYQKKEYNVISPLIGVFNIYNLMAVFLVMLELGYKIDDVIKRVGLIKKIPGRNEIIYNDRYTVMLDHAHTVNATRNILQFLKKFVKKRLIVVLGCAGERYREKRKVIGKLVLKYADIVIFTSDDPRSENVNTIIKEMLAGKKYINKNYYCIVNRLDALKKAISLANDQDFVLVLGRGRDNIMHLKDKDVLFSDYDELINLINK